MKEQKKINRKAGCMFTGIIEEVGEIQSIKKGANSAVITIKANTVLGDLHLGDSVALNGVCLTATSIGKNNYSVDVMHETLRRTNLGELKSGSKVNLERAMAANGRFGGHIVAGHVDGTGTISSMKKDDNAVWITIDTSAAILKYIISKGSITIDGVSLTVANVDNKSFAVSVIPHTGQNTTLLDKKPGDTVNLENDMVGKYVEKLLQYGSIPAEEEESTTEKTGITMDFLIQNGF